MNLPHPPLPAEAQLLRAALGGHVPGVLLLTTIDDRHLLIGAETLRELPEALPPADWFDQGEVVWLMDDGHLLGTLHFAGAQDHEPLRSLVEAVLLARRRGHAQPQVSAAMSNLPVPLLLLGEGGVVLASSRGALALLGQAAEQLEPGSVFPPPGTELPGALQAVIDAAWSGREGSAEFQFLGRSLRVQGNLWLDPGQPGVLLSFEDAAQRTLLRAEVARQAELLDLALARTAAHVLLIGDDGTLLAHSRPMHGGIVRDGFQGPWWQAGPFLERNAGPLSEALQRLRGGEDVPPMVLPWPRPGGAQHQLQVQLHLQGDLARLTLGDHTEQQRQQSALSQSQGVLSALLDHMPSAALLLGPGGELLRASAAAHDWLGDLPPVRWQQALDLSLPEGGPLPEQPWAQALAGQTAPWQELRWRTRRGERTLSVCAVPVPGTEGARGALLLMHDLTPTRRAEGRAQHHRTHDRLTGLPNRRALQDALDRAVECGEPMSLMLIATDQQELIEEALGSGAGDRALIELAARIRQVFGPVLVARGDGNAVAVLLPARDPGPSEQAEHLHRRMGLPLRLGGQSFQASVSVGITRLEPDVGADEAMRQALSALLAAQRHGGGTLHYRPDMHQHALTALSAENELRGALRGGGLTLGYQPIFDLQGGAVRGFEALLRWREPGREASPGQLLGRVGSGSLFDELGEWIITEVARDHAAWGGALPLSVNLNHHALLQGRALRAGLAALAQGVPLHFEMPEGLLVSHSEVAADLIRQVQAAGGGVGVDDLTLQSAFATLVGYGLNSVKLHRSLTAQLDEPLAHSLVSALLGLGAAHGVQVIAQGIERPAQLHALRGLDCRLGQGFLVGEPLPSAAVSALLATASPRVPLPAGAGA